MGFTLISSQKIAVSILNIKMNTKLKVNKDKWLVVVVVRNEQYFPIFTTNTHMLFCFWRMFKINLMCCCTCWWLQINWNALLVIIFWVFSLIYVYSHWVIHRKSTIKCNTNKVRTFHKIAKIHKIILLQPLSSDINDA